MSMAEPDLHQRLVTEMSARLAELPPAPRGQHWTFDCKWIDNEDGAKAMRLTARLVPAIRIEGE